MILKVEDNWDHTNGDVSGCSWEHPSHSRAGNGPGSPLPFLPSRALPDSGDKQSPPPASCPQIVPQSPI